MFDGRLVRDGMAVLSDDKLYRYRLTRRWSGMLDRPVCFCLLNPSTADAKQDDQTIRVCRGFAKLWGFGSMIVVNLYAFRATRPKAMWSAEGPVGPDNDQYILGAAQEAEQVIVAWGASMPKDLRCAAVAALLEPFKPYCLGQTASGEPRHPLYLKKNTERVLWTGCQHGKRPGLFPGE